MEYFVVYQPPGVTAAENHCWRMDVWLESDQFFIKFLNINQITSHPLRTLLACKLHNAIISFPECVFC